MSEDNGDLLALATHIVERAERTEQVEAFVTHEREFQAKAFKGEIESVSSAEPRGAGIRVVSQQRVGFSYTTDLTEEGLSEALEDARENARHSSPDDAAGVAEAASAYEDVPDLIDPAQDGVEADAKARFAVELEKATRGRDPRVRAVEEAGYSDTSTEVAIATSTGVRGSFKRTDAWCYTVALVSDKDETQMGFEFDIAKGLAGLDLEHVAEAAVQRGVQALGGKKIPSERLPIVFDPYVAGQFLGVVAAALTGEAVQKGRSLFAAKLGELVAATSLNLIDDGRLAGAPGSSPWDAEGVPTQRTEVIREGVLTSLLHDLKSARKDGVTPTGNASRAGFKSPPGIAPTNMALESTGIDRDALMRAAGRCFLVQDLHGVHSGANPISGDFSVGATGLLMEEGTPGKPVKEVTIAAPMLEILSGITHVADDRRWLPFGGSFGGSTTLVAEMTVAGT